MWDWLKNILGVAPRTPPRPIVRPPVRPAGTRPAQAAPRPQNLRAPSVPPSSQPGPRASQPAATPERGERASSELPRPSPHLGGVDTPSAPARVVKPSARPAIHLGNDSLDPELLQFPRAGTGAPTDLVVGFDFGTSCCKVAIQSPYKLDGRVSFANFGELAHSSCPWLLPVVLYAHHGGRLSLHGGLGSGEARHLKLGLLDPPANSPDAQRLHRRAIAAAAAYVGLALRAVRGNFLASKEDLYGTDRLQWQLNLGIPSASYDEDDIRRRFELIARTGWLLSLRSENPTWDTALDALDHSSLFSFTRVAVVPEVTAEVVTYAKSRTRKPDLHLVADMGASTLDLCAFQLHQEAGEDVFSLLTTSVQRLGLLELHRRRTMAVEKRHPFGDVPDDIVSELPSWEHQHYPGSIAEKLRVCDEAFVNECATALAKVLKEVRESRYPNSPRWTQGLPIFLAGGGAASEISRQVVQLANQKAKAAWSNFGGLVVSPLPVPRDVSGVEGVFSRLAVAYGLSFPDVNIGRMEPPSATQDIARDRGTNNWKGAFVDKSHV